MSDDYPVPRCRGGSRGLPAVPALYPILPLWQQGPLRDASTPSTAGCVVVPPLHPVPFAASSGYGSTSPSNPVLGGALHRWSCCPAPVGGAPV
jgi:hypothetical protein